MAGILLQHALTAERDLGQMPGELFRENRLS
jgi:hypothetical protein